MKVGSLCTGYAGLDLAVNAVLDSELAWCADNDPGAAKVLESRVGVPNLGDITTVDWTRVDLIRSVDVLTAGYPCQPFSHAGKRKGTKDERHLWPHVMHAIRVLRPRIVVLENVAGHLSLGFDVVTADLHALGYVGRWGIVRASDAGACHQRARLFVVAADADGGRLEERGEPDSRARELAASRRGDVDGRGPHVADADGAGLEGAEPAEGYDVSAWGDYGDAIRWHERSLGRPAPRPADGRGRLDPRFVEWMMMLPDGWVTDVIPNRTAALRILGNGVVPAAAEIAVRALLPKPHESRIPAMAAHLHESGEGTSE